MIVGYMATTSCLHSTSASSSSSSSSPMPLRYKNTVLVFLKFLSYVYKSSRAFAFRFVFWGLPESISFRDFVLNNIKYLPTYIHTFILLNGWLDGYIPQQPPDAFTINSLFIFLWGVGQTPVYWLNSTRIQFILSVYA